MGQIVSSAAKPKRCNANQLSQVPTPAAGEHILVSSDNSMNAAGQGYFDSYIIGDGTTAATSLELHKFKAEELDEQINGTFEQIDASYAVTSGANINKSFSTTLKGGVAYSATSNYLDFFASAPAMTVYFKKGGASGTEVARKTMALLITEGITLGEDIDTIIVYTAAQATSSGTLNITFTSGSDEGIVKDIETLSAQVDELEEQVRVVTGYDDETSVECPVVAGTTTNKVLPFAFPAGTYNLRFEDADNILTSATTIYFKNNGTNIQFKYKSGATATSIQSTRIGDETYMPLTFDQDVTDVQFYGGNHTESGIVKLVVELGHVEGLEPRVEEIENNYVSKEDVPFVKNVLFEADEVIPTGSGNYVFKDVFAIEGDDIEQDAMYVFTCDGPVASNNTASPLQIIQQDRTVIMGCRSSFNKLFAYIVPSRYSSPITKLMFTLYPYNSGVSFKNVKVYVWRQYNAMNELDAQTTSIAKHALAERIYSETCLSISHRGYAWLAPQNMLSAVVEAKRQGYRAVENDVALTSDNYYVMWHDTTLTKLGNLKDINGYYMYVNGNDVYWYDSDNEQLYTWDGSQYVASSVDVGTLTQAAGANYSVQTMTLALLKRLDFGSWKNQMYAGETIPTFEEWVACCKVMGVIMYIDQKIGDTYPQHAAALVGIVRKYGMLRHCKWVTGGHYNSVLSVDPKAKCILLSPPTTELITNLSSVITQYGEGCLIFEPEWNQLTAENAQAAFNAGFGVECYYVDFFPNTTDTSVIFDNIVNVMKLGVQGITIDIFTIEDVIAEKYLK